MAVYDKVDYHLEGLPRKVDPRKAYIGTGFYFAWAASRGLHSPDWEADEDFLRALQELRARTIEPAAPLERLSDGVLADDLFSDEGNRFTTYYYNSNKCLYYDDFYSVLVVRPIKHSWQLEGSWAEFDKLAAVIDQRYEAWKSAGRPELPYSTKSWWSRLWWAIK